MGALAGVFLPLAFLGTVETISAAEVTLSWDPNSEPDLAGYRLYYGTSKGEFQKHVDVGLQTTYKIANLSPGATYFLAVTAINSAGLESGFSNEVQFKSPLDPGDSTAEEDLAALVEDYFGADPAISAAKDSDGDGMSSLEEFLHGSNPHLPDASLTSAVEIISVDGKDYLSLKYPVRNVALTVGSVVAEVSTTPNNPGSWNSKDITIVSVNASSRPGFSEIVVRSSIPISQLPGQYLRLRYRLTLPSSAPADVPGNIGESPSSPKT